MKKSPASGKTSSRDAWQPWQPTTHRLKISPAILAETVCGGQAFRWRKMAGSGHPEVWQGAWSNCVARVRVGQTGELEWSCPTDIAHRVAPALESYFAIDVDFTALADQLPWRTDAILLARMRAWPGLRLLRQPLGETLLAFLCSSAKQIPHIMQCCEKMAERFGEPISGEVRTLPTWSRLAEISESDLRTCGLGYRAKFIKDTAMRLASEPGWEVKIHQASYSEAQEWLTSLTGVGPKIADCVLLFGAAKYEAFPVDTWILRAMAKRYSLNGWPPAQVAQFGRSHFGHLAGLAQQFLFSGERKSAKE